jgi:hypothetical protein
MTLPEIVNQIDILNRRQPKDKAKKIHRAVIFDPPPPISEKIDNKVSNLYHDIDELCAKVDIDTEDGGIEQPWNSFLMAKQCATKRSARIFANPRSMREAGHGKTSGPH